MRVDRLKLLVALTEADAPTDYLVLTDYLRSDMVQRRASMIYPPIEELLARVEKSVELLRRAR